MKKIILSIAMISAISFTSCSTDAIVKELVDQIKLECQECTLQAVVTKVCDNGDGSVTVTANGVDTVVEVEYNIYIAAQKTAGATCK